MDYSILILISMMGIVFSYHFSVGNFFYPYASQVGAEAQNSAAVCTNWFTVLAISLTTSSLIDWIGIVGTFGFFGICSFISFLFHYVLMVDTEGMPIS